MVLYKPFLGLELLSLDTNREMKALAILVIVLVVLIIGSIRRPSLAFAAFFLQIGLDQLALAAHPVFATNRALMNYFVAGIVALATTQRLLRGQLVGFPVSAAWVLVFALYGYAWTTLVWAPPIPEGLGGAAYVPNHLAANLPYFILAIVLVPTLLRQVSELREPLQFFLIMGSLLLIGLILLAEFHASERGLVVAGTNESTSGLSLATFGGVAVLAAIFIPFRKGSRVFVALRAAVLVLGLIAIVGTGSRGQLFAVLFVTAVVWPLTQDKSVVFRYLGSYLVLLVLILATWGAFEIVGDRLVGRWSVGDVHGGGTISGRLAAQVEMMTAAFSAWQKSPASIIFGVGNSGSFSLLPFQFYPHNVPLEVLMELGVVGFALYCGVLVLGYRSFRKLLVRFRGDRGSVRDICFLFAIGLFFFLRAMKEGSFATVGHYSLLVPILLANLDLAESRALSARPAQRSGSIQNAE